jgi:hypothetical protein
MNVLTVISPTVSTAEPRGLAGDSMDVRTLCLLSEIVLTLKFCIIVVLSERLLERVKLVSTKPLPCS